MVFGDTVQDRVDGSMAQAYDKAIDALSRYKFLMFGYHAAQWVTLNKCQKIQDANPFKPFVKFAKNQHEIGVQVDLNGKCRTIIVEVKDGLIQAIREIPLNMRVEVHDFDCTNPDDEGVSRTEGGELYTQSVWTE